MEGFRSFVFVKNDILREGENLMSFRRNTYIVVISLPVGSCEVKEGLLLVKLVTKGRYISNRTRSALARAHSCRYLPMVNWD